LKPPKFDGKKPFEPFIRQFRACSEHNEWDLKEQRAQLANCLEGQAQQILWDSETRVQEYTELEALLQKRYGAELQNDKHRMELKARKRRAEESLMDLHQDIRRLWTLAQFPSEGKSANIMMTEAFLDALNNPSLAHEVRRDKPRDYDDTLNLALAAESLFSETKRARELAQAIKDREHTKETKSRSRNLASSEQNTSQRKRNRPQGSSLNKNLAMKSERLLLYKIALKYHKQQ
jgi:hypothetical protein